MRISTYTLPLLALPFFTSTSASHSPNSNSRLRHKRAASAQDYSLSERAQLDQLEETQHHNQTIEKRGPSYHGTGTYFYVGLGACGQYSQDSDLMVALSELYPPLLYLLRLWLTWVLIRFPTLWFWMYVHSFDLG